MISAAIILFSMVELKLLEHAEREKKPLADLILVALELRQPYRHAPEL